MKIILSETERSHLKRTLKWVLAATRQEEESRSIIKGILEKIKSVGPISPEEI